MSFLKVLGFDPAKHNVKTEIVAGITTSNIDALCKAISEVLKK